MKTPTKTNPQPKKPTTTKKSQKPLIQDKKAMKKIVAKHEDVMGFFEKIKVKMQNKPLKAKQSTENGE